MAGFRAQVFAETTKRTYASHLKSYLTFCKLANLQPIPISTQNLGCYAAFLSARLSYSSVRQYLNVVRLLHVEANAPDPFNDQWFLSSLFKGMRRTMGDSCKPKLPITVPVMRKIFHVLDFSMHRDVVFWAACLVAFFSFLRKSNLFFEGKAGSSHYLRLADLTFLPLGVVLNVRSSKTNQFASRRVEVPLPRIPQSVFCPAQACLLLCKMYRRPPHAPLFQFQEAEGLCTLTYSRFLTQLKRLLRVVGIDPSQYAGHSFRRGGATLALSCNVPSELVKLHGDWASSAYMRYFEPSLRSKFQLVDTMAQQFC